MPDFFLTLERQLALEVDSPEIRDYVRSTYARTRIARPVRGVPLDRAAIHGSGPQPSVEFNGTKIDLEKSTAHSAFRFGFYGSNRLFRESFRRNDAWLSFHGAALALPAGAIVAVAESGAGKTTLALALLDRGARLLSDEFVFVRKTDRVVSGYPRTFMIREPALAQIENRRVHQRCAVDHAKVSSAGFNIWHAIDPVDIYGPDVYASSAPLAGIVLLERCHDGAAPRCEPIATAVASLELARRLNSDAEGFARLSNLAALFSGVPAYRVTLGDPKDAAAVLAEAFR
jgi:hypothetical protein